MCGDGGLGGGLGGWGGGSQKLGGWGDLASFSSGKSADTEWRNLVEEILNVGFCRFVCFSFQ